LPESDVVQIQDRAGRLDGMADLGGAGGKALGEALFVFDNESLQLSLLGRDAIERFDVEFA
jgi:hypothetical protein